MTYPENITILQHWISHICHELVSPVGAINNGVELMAEIDPNGHHQDALDLIAESGRMAATKLRFYRLAYGMAGRARDISLRDIQKAALDLFSADGRIAFVLDADEQLPLKVGVPQLILNLLLMASHCLPRGGNLTFTVGANSVTNSTVSILIRATGTQARIPESSAEILIASPSKQSAVPPIDHRNCHAAMCMALLQNLGLDLAVKLEPESVLFCFDAPIHD